MDQYIQHKGLHICSICTLCEKQEKFIQHLIFECPSALHIWSWVQQIFLILISIMWMISFLLLRAMVVFWLI